MKIKFAAASMMALALFAGPSLAQQDATQPAPAAEDAAAPAQLPEAVLALINDRRSSQELSDDELKARAKQARQAAKTKGLPDDVKAQLQAMVDSDRAELETRSASAQPAEKKAEPVQEAAPAPAPQPEEAPAAAAAAAPAEIPADVTEVLNDSRPLDSLSADELKQRAQFARQQSKNQDLPEDVRQRLGDIAKSARTALMAMEQAAPAPEKKAEEPAVQPEAAPVQEAAPATPQPEAPAAAAATAEIPADVTALLNDKRPLDTLSADELKQRAQFARQQARNKDLPEDVRQQLGDISKAARAAVMAMDQNAPAPATPPAQEQAQQPAMEPAAPATQPPASDQNASQPEAAPTPPPVDKADVKQLDANPGDPAAEKQARVYLDDKTAADSLSDEDLRKRLDGIRDLLAENELSAKTERALRDKLRSERDVLRERVAKAKAAEEAKAAAATPQQPATNGQQPAPADQSPRKRQRPNINIIITADTPFREILRDRRDPEQMDESEIRYRIRAQREFEASQDFQSYDEDQRQAWRERTMRDREYLRRQLEQDRDYRRTQLDREGNIRRIVIEDDQQFNEDDIPEDIFAAEVSDDEIERALLAPPRRKITRRISVDEIATQPEARKALTRIEIDTIRFGFNEAFVREEEVDNLDQLASVIEKVLKKYPREVFLIEGHTDAVGSDAYNDKLSKARAEAVKKALTTYYIIPAKNLQTVGLGERYLKIPTAEAEQENRRVSISRATAVVGEAEE